MGSKLKIIIWGLVAHFFLCLIMSFEWDFLWGGGFYLGFWLTLLILYIPSLAVIMAGYSIVDFIISLKDGRQWVKLTCCIIGVWVIFVFLGSWMGLLSSGILQSIGYLSIPLGILSIVALNIVEIKNKRTYIKRAENNGRNKR